MGKRSDPNIPQAQTHDIQPKISSIGPGYPALSHDLRTGSPPDRIHRYPRSHHPGHNRICKLGYRTGHIPDHLHILPIPVYRRYFQRLYPRRVLPQIQVVPVDNNGGFSRTIHIPSDGCILLPAWILELHHKKESRVGQNDSKRICHVIQIKNL